MRYIVIILVLVIFLDMSVAVDIVFPLPSLRVMS